MRKRRNADRAAQAEAMWVARNAKHNELRAYCDQLQGIDRTLPPEALEGAARRASAHLPGMTMAEYRNRRMH